MVGGSLGTRLQQMAGASRLSMQTVDGHSYYSACRTVLKSFADIDFQDLVYYDMYILQVPIKSHTHSPSRSIESSLLRSDRFYKATARPAAAKASIS